MRGMPSPKDAAQQKIYRGLQRMLPAGLMEKAAWLGACLIPEEGDTSGKQPARFSPGEKLPASEKTKMDYEQHLKRNYLLLDKLALGAVVGLAVLLATIYLDNRKDAETRSLEQFKLDETQRQFLLGKRLDALNEVSTAMSNVTTTYFYYTGIKKDASEKEAYERYGNALDKSGMAIDRTEILFPLGFREDMERYQAVHRAVWRIGVQKCGGQEYRDFFMSLSREFDKNCFEILMNRSTIDDLKKQDNNRMPLTFNAKERERMTSEVYLKKQYEYWTKTDAAKVKK
jgi:hypothetical protein